VRLVAATDFQLV